MRIAVVGGAGFVGRHLSSALFERGQEVLVYDDLSARARGNDVAWLRPLQLVQADLLDRPGLQKALASFRPDLIYHLASLHYIPYCDEHPKETLQINVEGTLNLMLVAQQLPRLRGMVFASSVAVYPPTDHYHTESGPTRPCDIYGLSKSLGEQIVEPMPGNHGQPHFGAASQYLWSRRNKPPCNPGDSRSDTGSGLTFLHLGRTDACRDFEFLLVP